MNHVYAKVKSVKRIDIVRRVRDTHNNQVAFVAKLKNSGVGNEEKSKLVCTSYKKSGHTTDTCFQVIGYPDWWGERSRLNRRGGGRSGLGGRGRGTSYHANAVTVKRSRRDKCTN